MTWLHPFISCFLVASLLTTSLVAQQKSTELIPYRIDDKMGFSDKEKNMVIPAIYDRTFLFNEGRAKVQIGKNYGFIDSTGTVVVPIEYYRAYDFKNGIASS